MRTIFVSGALANRPRNGGGAWVRLSWVRGLRRLGFHVHFVEHVACEHAARESGGLAFFRSTCDAMDLSRDATLVYGQGPQTLGKPWDELVELAGSADLLVNLGGHLELEPLRRQFRKAAYIDLDPGFTQFWHADADGDFRVAPHDFYYTIAANIGRTDCPIPSGDIPWRTMRQPVVLQDWPVASGAGDPPPCRFTTVASWRGAFGPVSHAGKTYGVKAHEFRKFASLPTLTPGDFELALDIQPADAKDAQLLRDNGWRLTDPRAAAGNPASFRAYVQGSSAEFSVAQGIYVETNSGWFSDRTVRYLASGRPALVQETGFSRTIPSGDGLLAFATPDDAADGAARIAANYASHRLAARQIAEQYFDSGKVLGRFLDEVGVCP